ncbi:MAG: XRE family transcriptional regulator [Gammaproteobacteria bacterium]|nr:MAG: XRE family transcriptional regulator [Gammaproteobacteria bacterium]
MKIVEKAVIDQYYQALLDKNPDYLGVFFVAVKTTGVFCIPTCHAKKPKKHNIEFYHTVKEALEAGYRPCKICKPAENAYKPPQAVRQALQMVTDKPKCKITDDNLKQQDISPHTVRRWFKSHYGMTYHAFQRMYRITNAYQELQQGGTATETAFDSGYSSLSGFGYTYKKLTGHPPSHSDHQSLIQIGRLTTPIGPMVIGATNLGICLLEFINRKSLETELQDLQQRRNARILLGENTHIKQAGEELDEYFAGKRQQFDVALDPIGTDFRQLVWRSLLTIPYGTTISYLDQAKRLGREKSLRAVASANGYNKISIIIPCHRVIGSDGSLTGYGGGLERKKWLLDLEKSHR